ncbi:tRNA 2-selenouridine(34) synthase MnmH [Bacillus marinisedimentorum]|uniref:tRNA 2-selenouridine(34) synthase MnmH n=1 Tax=Bacillus marinisedimentorum TaxID=1821260 RepID=UPI0007DEE9C9|nr:tRNA 2-selenouridine(34) synthase MnmH [Bacillus marinisedimentorum]
MKMDSKPDKMTIYDVEHIDNPCFVDVRSPAEFAEYHMPGAVNIPIFDNGERAEIGTLYKQRGREPAKERGLEVLSGKLPIFYERFQNIIRENPDSPIVVYCWRGGMRSGAVVTTMNMMELPVVQLEGGIRSYRKKTVSELEEAASEPKPFVVLEGHTGTRKTDVLQALKSEGYPVIDLEGLARHRGSIFGNIGLNPSSQKEFEANLAAELKRYKRFPYYLIEAESKRIGPITLPDFIVEGKEKGIRVKVEMPFAERISNIMQTYVKDGYLDEFNEAARKLKKKLKPLEAQEELERNLLHGDYRSVISMLLEYYYDPRYSHASDGYDTPVFPVAFTTLNEGIARVKGALEEIESEYALGNELSEME